MRQAPKVMLLAGEASGDHHAAGLVAALRRANPRLQAFGLGGPAMRAAGMRLDYDLASHGVIGFFEVIKHLPALMRVESQALETLKRERPDVVVTVDYPGFNLRFAKKAHALGFKTVHYVSPQVWAWKAGRPRKMARYLDRQLVTFPFEKRFYDAAGLPCAFVGNPLMDAIAPKASPAAVRRARGWGKATLVGLLPGSRPQEVGSLLPVMLKTAALMAQADPRRRFLLFKAPALPMALFEGALAAADPALKVEVVEPRAGEDAYALRRACDVAMVASGTATLETAILGVPFVLLYRINPLTYQAGKRLIKLKYIGLANVVAGEKIVPEFIQEGLRPHDIAASLEALLADPQAQVRALKPAVKSLGGPGAARRAAREVLDVAAKPSRFA